MAAALATIYALLLFNGAVVVTVMAAVDTTAVETIILHHASLNYVNVF